MSRNQSNVPPREVVNGSRRCVVCKRTDLACPCADEHHHKEAYAILGMREREEVSDE